MNNLKPVYSWFDVLSAHKEMPKVKIDAASLLAMALSIGLYVWACNSPALIVNDGQGVIKWTGLHCLQEGFLAVFRLQFAWFANFWIFMSLLSIFFRNWKGVRNFSGIAIILGLQSFMIINTECVQNEGGVGPPFKMLGLDYGFYIWIASFAVIFLLGVKRLSSSR